MQFVLIGKDGTDENALERRMAVREDHLAMCAHLKTQGRYLTGGPILDDADRMIGSVVFYDFPTRQELDTWLKTEPYVKGNVWQNIEIHPVRLAQYAPATQTV